MKNKKPKLVYKEIEEDDVQEVIKRVRKFLEYLLKANIEFQYSQKPQADDKEIEAVWSQIRHSEKALKNIQEMDDDLLYSMYMKVMTNNNVKPYETFFTIGSIAFFFDEIGGKVLENEPNR